MEQLQNLVNSAFDDGRTPFFIVSHANLPVVGLRLELGFPHYLRSSIPNQIIQDFNPQVHEGFIFDGVCQHHWPDRVSIGSFYTLVTGDNLEGLTNANHPRYVPFPIGKRILIATTTPENLMNDWRIAFEEVLGEQEEEQLRNLFETAFHLIQPIYVEVDENLQEQEEFQEWLNPTNG